MVTRFVSILEALTALKASRTNMFKNRTTMCLVMFPTTLRHFAVNL